MNRNNWRLPLCIAISSVFITPVYAELTILPGETYLNTVILENIDLILNQGTFENSALVNNLDLSTFNNQGSTLNNGDMFFQYQSALLNYGSFENFGRLIFSDTARLDNYASFLNSGIVEISALTNQTSGVFTNTATGVITMNGNSSINNAGVFNHFGNITSDSFVAPFINILNNSGTFNNNGSFTLPYNEFRLNNSGTFNNNTDLTLAGPSSKIVNTGNFENNGRVSVLGSLINTATGVFNNLIGQRVEVSGVLNNQGVFNNDSELLINDSFDSLTGSITVAELNNSGTFNNNTSLTLAAPLSKIVNSGSFENNGQVSVWGSLINTATGVFNNLIGQRVEVSGSLNNQGLFNNDSELSVNEGFNSLAGVATVAELNNSGTFNNNSILVSAGQQGLNLTNSGGFNNNAGINSEGRIAINNSGVFSNSVLIDLRGINTFGLSEGSLVNSGTFNNASGSVVGLGYLENNATFENSNGTVGADGRLLNNTMGVFNNGPSGFVFVTGVLENRGDFNNQFELSLAENPDTFDPLTGRPLAAELNNSGTFNNSGNIQATGSEGLNLTNSGTFQNRGLIQGVNSLLNSGRFESNGSVDVMGQFVNSITGVFNNGSEFFIANVDVTGVLQNQGEFNNSARIQLTESFDVSTGMIVAAELNNSGVFNNVGEILTNSFNLVINNSGEFNHTGQMALAYNTTINNAGTFNNGDMLNPAQNSFLLSGNAQINNSGTFNNYRALDGGISTKLVNRGVLNNNSSINGFNQFINEGTINNQDNAYQSRIAVNNTLDNRGTLNNAGTSIIELGYGGSAKILNTGSVINNGEIIGSGDINNKGTIINNTSIQGAINIVSSGLITNTGSIIADNVEISGRLEGTGDINVVAGVNGLVITEAGTLAPAYINNPDNPFAPPGLTLTGMLTLDGTLEVTFNEFGFFDPMTVTGPVQLGTNSVLDVSLQDYNWGLGASYDLMYAYSIAGDFGDFFYGSPFDPSLALEWSVFNDGFRDILRIDVVSAVPLPASVWLFLSGIVGLISIRRRRHS
jgi:filamentous hemagglutinin